MSHYIERIKTLQWRLHNHYATRLTSQVNTDFVHYIESEIERLNQILIEHGVKNV